MNGNYVNDSFIKIKVDFDTRFDYKNILQDEEEGTYIYDENKAESFITKLMDGTYGSGKGKGKGSRTGKGKGKRKGKGKTLKNRRR